MQDDITECKSFINEKAENETLDKSVKPDAHNDKVVTVLQKFPCEKSSKLRGWKYLLTSCMFVYLAEAE